MLLKQLWVLLTCLGWALLSRAERPDDTSNGHDIIAKGHGGTLAVDTRVGQGTEFIITLSQA